MENMADEQYLMYLEQEIERVKYKIKMNNDFPDVVEIYDGNLTSSNGEVSKGTFLKIRTIIRSEKYPDGVNGQYDMFKSDGVWMNMNKNGNWIKSSKKNQLLFEDFYNKNK